jgi:hypothetical protein
MNACANSWIKKIGSYLGLIPSTTAQRPEQELIGLGPLAGLLASSAFA